MAAPRPTYTVGIRSIEHAHIIEEHAAIAAAVLDSGVLRVTFDSDTEYHYSPAMWTHVKRSGC